MIIIMKESASAKEIESVEKLLAEFGFQTHPIQGEKKTVIGAIGDKRLLSMNQILTMDGVENVVPIMKPYKLASKELHKEPSVIEIGHGITVGGSLQYLQVLAQSKARNSSQLYQRLLRPRVQTFFAAVRSSHVHHHIHSKVLRVTA